MPPSPVGSIASVAEADQLLEGLEQLAQSGKSDKDFWRQFLIVVRGLTGASSVGVLFPAQLEWVTVAVAGELPENHLREISQECLEGSDAQGTWIAAAIEIDKVDSGVLLIDYLPTATPALIDSGRLLLDPFCEILRMRLGATRPELDRQWSRRMEACIRNLAHASSQQHLRQVLVDQMVLVLGGDRASMVVRDSGSNQAFQLVSSSGASLVDRMSPTVKRLEQLAEMSFGKEAPIQWSDRSPIHQTELPSGSQQVGEPSRDSFGIFANGIVLAWDRLQGGVPVSWLILEWSDPTAMEQSLPFLSSWCNTIHSVWLQQDRWVRLPSRIQSRLTQRSASMAAIGSRWVRRLVWMALAIGLIWGMFVPFPMTIESKAILEPTSRRIIHASADGYLEELLVDDGDQVVAQQAIARLRSPNLDLQIEEATGRLRAIAEKRNGLKIAINQLSPNAPDALANQTRLSTELLMLDSNETHVREMLSFYQAEESRLVLRSPIDGVVVAKQLRQELENRPIRRGDPILQVVDLSGDWQLRVQVADRDSDYVGRYYGGRNAPPLEKEVQYTFDSLPSEQFMAEVFEISRVIENRDGAGGFQEVLVRVQRADASKAYMGATARVRFSCGREPFGYVWSRPLIEFLQKRFRIFSWPPSDTK